MKELDGGQLDMPELSCMKVVLQICDDNDLDSTSLRRAPLSMVETLQEAAYEQMQAEASQVTASAQLPEAQEQALDEYIGPCIGISAFCPEKCSHNTESGESHYAEP